MELMWARVLMLGLVFTGALLAIVEDESNRANYLRAKVGKHVIFSCPIDFPHEIPVPYSLQWNKENQMVFSWSDGEFRAADDVFQGRVSLVPELGAGSVNLTNIRQNDGGWYECKVFFPNRWPSSRPNGTWFHLLVDGGELLTTPPINVTTLENEPAHFPCVTKPRNTTVTVKWYKDGIELSEAGDLVSRSQVDSEGSLTILKTDMSDGGEFKCVVTIPGERQEAGAFLDVQFKAKVVYSPTEIYLPYGRNASLDCHFRANPPLTNIRWEKDGFLYDPYNVPGVFYRRNTSLFFHTVNESHAGIYTCTPTNELGSAGSSGPIRVVVQRPPVFTVSPHNLYLRKIGDTLEMACDAVDGGGQRRPTLVWLRGDGTPLPLDRLTLRNGNLTLQDLRLEDAGQYQCVASNEAATISADTEVKLENVSPRAPYNVTATSNESAVSLTWAAGQASSGQQYSRQYSVWYRPADSPEWRTAPVTSHGIHQTTISPLSPGRLYEFMVLRHNDQGDGMFSKALRVKTAGVSQPHAMEVKEPGHKPPSSFQLISPPRNLGVNLTEAGHVITWEPPEFGENELQVYRVHWALGPDELSLGNAETTHNYLLVPDLESDTTYYFQVSAVSTNEYTAPSSQIAVHVPSERNMRALAVGSAVGLAFLGVAAAAAIYLKKVYSVQAATQAKTDDPRTTRGEDKKEEPRAFYDEPQGKKGGP